MDIFTRKAPRRVSKYYSREQSDKYLDGFTEGSEIIALSNGQFSLSDLIESILSSVGKSHVDISTWTASGYDAARMIDLIDTGSMLSMRWVIDDIFVKRQPKLAKEILKKSGSMRVTKTHAKFVIFKGGEFDCVLLTSMNLNANPRIEQFQISSDIQMVEFFSRLVDNIHSCEEGRRVTLADLEGFNDENEEEVSW